MWRQHYDGILWSPVWGEDRAHGVCCWFVRACFGRPDLYCSGPPLLQALLWRRRLKVTLSRVFLMEIAAGNYIKRLSNGENWCNYIKRLSNGEDPAGYYIKRLSDGDCLIDCLVFYVVPAIFQPCNGGLWHLSDGKDRK